MDKHVTARFSMLSLYEHPQVGAVQAHEGSREVVPPLEIHYRSRQGVSYGPTVSGITTIGLPIPAAGTSRRTMVAYANTTAMEVDTDVLTANTYTVANGVGAFLFVEGETTATFREWPPGVSTADTLGSES